jgi:hypothetical protein
VRSRQTIGLQLTVNDYSSISQNYSWASLNIAEDALKMILVAKNVAPDFVRLALPFCYRHDGAEASLNASFIHREFHERLGKGLQSSCVGPSANRDRIV